ncbi:MAG: zinc-dependent alcohol dehydrogenase family protein [Candidatus Sericytochromatia bacterium]|nr:zinc-dependent alcohol dehydrogenase family protein [Candidatus Sericytochromatia bacterium]
MKKVLCIGPNDDASRSIRVEDVPEPECPDAGVLVDVKVRPINPADLLLLNGRHVFTPNYPEPVGIEGVGIVAKAGPASHLSPGTVVALPYGGTWCERLAMPDDVLLPLPANVDLDQASMLCVNPFTAVGLLEGVPDGGTVVMNAANSAIARLVLGVARRRGLPLIAVVRDESQAPALLAAGAKAVLTDGEDLAARVAEVAATPVLRALDAVAGMASGRLYDCLEEGGDLVVYGLLGADEVRLPAARLVFRDVVVRGYSRLRNYRAMTHERRGEIREELLALLAEGTLRTEVEARYPLESVAEALRHQQRAGRRGKILLVS